MAISGIYRIVNKVNGKCYIGSTKNLHHRWSVHKHRLSLNQHHSIILQRAWNKYGQINFKIELIEVVSPKNLLQKEQEFIDKLKPAYNVGSVGGGDNVSQHPNLDQIRKKHSENSKARWANMTPSEYQNTCNAVRGSKNPNWKGGVSSPECPCGKVLLYGHKLCSYCAKLGDRNPFFGKTHSEATLKRLREAGKCNKPANSNSIIINDVIYESQSAAARAFNVSIGTMSNWTTGKIHKKGIIIQLPQNSISDGTDNLKF